MAGQGHACPPRGRGIHADGIGRPAEDDQPGTTVFVALVVPAANAERIFNALAEDGRVTMPFEKTFWSPGFGMLVDPFGIPWMVNTEPAS